MTPSTTPHDGSRYPDGGADVLRRADQACLNILVVDDDPLVSLDIATMLTDLGHLATEAHSAEQAIGLLEGGAPIDFVFTDYRLGVMSGGDLIREVFRRWPAIKCAVTSGYPRSLLGVPHQVPCLSKPFAASSAAKLIEDMGPWSPRVRGAG